MKFSCSGKDFEIPDTWQIKAGVLGWTPSVASYPATADPHYPTIVIPFGFIAPPKRDLGTPWFDETRMVRILQGLRSGILLPPIELHEPPDGSMFRYAVRDGFHRFYAAAALGFTHLPATVYPYFAFDS